MVKSLHLTDEQQMLFDQHFPLVHFILRKYFPHVPPCDYEDYVQVGSIGLCKAIIKHDPGKSRLSTFAGVCIRSHMVNYEKLSHSACRDRSCEAYSLDDGEFRDHHPSADDVESIAMAHELIEQIRRLPSRDKRIMILHMMGYSQRCIARREHLSPGYINKQVKNIQQRLRREVCA